MKNNSILLALLLAIMVRPAEAVDFDLSASATARWAIDSQNGTTQALGITFEPELVTRFDNGWKLTSIARLLADPIAGIRPGDMIRQSYSAISKPLLLGNGAELELREFYLEGTLGDSYITIGKQQVVWGKADGLKVLDVVNPQSFRQFILEPFDDSRIPLWTLNIERTIGEWDLQFLWIPDQTYHALPKRDATYAFTSPLIVPRAPPGVAVDLRNFDRPDNIITDSDVGLRLATFIGGWDLSFNYLYQYDNLPVFFQHRTERDGQPLVVVNPRYQRTHLLGTSFSKAFGDWVIRSEAGFSSDRYFITTNPADQDGIISSPELSYVIGLDWSGAEDTFISGQLFQSWVIDPKAGMTRKQLESTATLLARRNFLHDTLIAEVLWLTSLNRGDGLVRPKIS